MLQPQALVGHTGKVLLPFPHLHSHSCPPLPFSKPCPSIMPPQPHLVALLSSSERKRTRICLGEGMELCSSLCAKFSHHSTLESREGLGLNYQALQLSSCLAFRKLLNPSGFMLLITYYFIYIHNTAVIACWFIHLTNHMPLCCSPPIPCPLPAVSVGQGMSP